MSDNDYFWIAFSFGLPAMLMFSCLAVLHWGDYEKMALAFISILVIGSLLKYIHSNYYFKS